MNLLELCNLQGSLFLMILAGAVLKRRGIISKEGEKCLTDLCVNIVIPCNIVKSCLISFDASILKRAGCCWRLDLSCSLSVWHSTKCCLRDIQSSTGRCFNTVRSFPTADSSETRLRKAYMEVWDFSTHPFS